MKQSPFGKTLYTLSFISIIITIATGIFLPYLTSIYSDYIGQPFKFSTVIFIWLTIGPFLIILLSVNNLVRNQPFQKTTIKYLKIILYSSTMEIFLYCIGLIIYKNLLCFVILCGTIMIFLISAAILEIIRHGIQLQEDNDLTI